MKIGQNEELDCFSSLPDFFISLPLTSFALIIFKCNNCHPIQCMGSGEEGWTVIRGVVFSSFVYYPRVTWGDAPRGYSVIWEILMV